MKQKLARKQRCLHPDLKFLPLFLLLFIGLIPPAEAQYIGIFGEYATSTSTDLKNHRGVGIMYAKHFKSGIIWQSSISKGYSSFQDYYDKDFNYYGNRISINSAWMRPFLGDSRKGLCFGAGLALDHYYATRYLTPVTAVAVHLQLQYQETNVLGTPIGVFVNAKPKASIGLLQIFGCYDCTINYSEPMLILEVNAGLTYNFKKKNKQRE